MGYTVRQVAEVIDEKKWFYSIRQILPVEKDLVIDQPFGQGTTQHIEDLIRKNKSTEIVVTPKASDSKNKVFGSDQSIKIKINNNTNNSNFNDMSKFDINALAGLNGFGLNMAEIFTAKEKASENQELKKRVDELEKEIKGLEKENLKLENKIHLDEIKTANRNELVEMLKSPQVISIAQALLSRAAPAPALSGTAPEQHVNDEKIQWLVNFLTDEATPELTKDFMIYIAKAHQVENSQEILKELAYILKKHKIINQ